MRARQPVARSIISIRFKSDVPTPVPVESMARPITAQLEDELADADTEVTARALLGRRDDAVRS